MYYLGVDLGGTTIKAGLFDEQLQLLKMVQKNTGASLGADIVLKRIEKCLEILVLKNNLLFEQIDALGIGVPGLVKIEMTVFLYFLLILIIGTMSRSKNGLNISG